MGQRGHRGEGRLFSEQRTEGSVGPGEEMPKKIVSKFSQI